MLVCPKCSGTGFSIIDSVECGPEGSRDENTIQRAQCTDCDSYFLCRYTESRSFGPGSDRVSHRAWLVPFAFWTMIESNFTTPERKVASGDRVRKAERALATYSAHEKAMPIRYDPNAKPKPDVEIAPQEPVAELASTPEIEEITENLTPNENLELSLWARILQYMQGR